MVSSILIVFTAGQWDLKGFFCFSSHFSKLFENLNKTTRGVAKKKKKKKSEHSEN